MMRLGSLIALTFALTLALIYVSLTTGPGHWDGRWPDADVLMSFRLPRTLNAVAAGGSLALAGLLLQTLLRNPLAEPYTLGLSGGATLGAVLSLLVFGERETTMTLFAFVGSWITSILVLFFHAKGTHATRRSLVLFGLMISLFCGSLVSLILSLADAGQLQRAMMWMIGSVSPERGMQGAPLLPVLILIALLWMRSSRALDTLLLGTDSAINILGSLQKLERGILLTVTILTAWAVSACGLIGFVGLLSPQIAFRVLKTRRHQWTIPASVLNGMCLLLIADILGRLIGGSLEIPAGGIAALIGAPFLAWLLIKGQAT